LPAGLVWVHVSGSLLIWMVALRLMFAVRDRGPLMQPPPPADGAGAVSAARTEPEPQTEPAPAR
jgi:hypothetical protein